MTEEKLNKMKWLQEQGLKPDYVFYSQGFCKDGVADLRKVSDLEGFEKDIVNCWFGGNKYAWFSESKLWSLLPEWIKRREEYETLTGEFSTSNVFYELVIEKYRKKTSIAYSVPVDQRESFRSLIEFESDDLHDALLDMVIWCVENGYLKAEGNK
jgi:hypothetical protein